MNLGFQQLTEREEVFGRTDLGNLFCVTSIVISCPDNSLSLSNKNKRQSKRHSSLFFFVRLLRASDPANGAGRRRSRTFAAFRGHRESLTPVVQKHAKSEDSS